MAWRYCKFCGGNKRGFVWRYERGVRMTYYVPCSQCQFNDTGSTGRDDIDEALAWFKTSQPPQEPFFLWPRLKVHWPDRFWQQLRDELEMPVESAVRRPYEEVVQLFRMFGFEEWNDDQPKDKGQPDAA